MPDDDQLNNPIDLDSEDQTKSENPAEDEQAKAGPGNTPEDKASPKPSADPKPKPDKAEVPKYGGAGEAHAQIAENFMNSAKELNNAILDKSKELNNAILDKLKGNESSSGKKDSNKEESPEESPGMGQSMLSKPNNTADAGADPTKAMDPTAMNKLDGDAKSQNASSKADTANIGKVAEVAETMPVPPV